MIGEKAGVTITRVERDRPLFPLPEPSPPAAPSPAEPSWRSWARRAVSPLVILVIALVKWGAKLKGVLLLLPKLKILTTSGTMLVSIGAYALIWGWKFGVGFVLLLLVHEMGHVIQLRREGIESSAPMFIPFLGAVVAAKSLGRDALAEARVGLAGPILGTLGAAAVVPLYWLTGNELFLALAFVGFFLNLFNLLPVVPLDGGRAMAAMAPWMWFAGFAGLIGLTFAFPNPIMLLILLFGGMETWRRWKAKRRGGREQEAYYQVRPAARLAVAAVYIGLIVACAAGMAGTFVERGFPA